MFERIYERAEQDGSDIVIMCAEKNVNVCHRSDIGVKLKMLGYDVDTFFEWDTWMADVTLDLFF